MNHGSVLYIGLRDSETEWKAAIDTAELLGYGVKVVSDSDISFTGISTDSRYRFEKNSELDQIVDRVLDWVSMADFQPSVVTCWSDMRVRVSARIAAALHVRGPGVAAADICSDKIAQRRLLDTVGLSPVWRAGHTVDDLRRAGESIQPPFVFKPAYSSGARGVTKINRASALLNEVRLRDLISIAGSANYVPSTAFVLEHYVDGSEHSVAGIVSDGFINVYAVTDKVVGEQGLGSIATLLPSALTEHHRAAVVASAKKAVDVMGIEYGGFHVDVRLENGRPYVLEVGARLGGDMINSTLVPIATSGSFYPYLEHLVVLQSGLPCEKTAVYKRGAAMVMHKLGPAWEHSLSATEMIALVTEHPAVYLATMWSTVGDTIAIVLTADCKSDLSSVIFDFKDWLGRKLLGESL